MHKKIILDFIAISNLNKSARGTGSKIGYIPPALKIWKGTVDVYDTLAKEFIPVTIHTAPAGYTRGDFYALITATIHTSPSSGREFIPATIHTSLAHSTEVGGV